MLTGEASASPINYYLEHYAEPIDEAAKKIIEEPKFQALIYGIGQVDEEALGDIPFSGGENMWGSSYWDFDENVIRAVTYGHQSNFNRQNTQARKKIAAQYDDIYQQHYDDGLYRDLEAEIYFTGESFSNYYEGLETKYVVNEDGELETTEIGEKFNFEKIARDELEDYFGCTLPDYYNYDRDKVEKYAAQYMAKLNKPAKKAKI